MQTDGPVARNPMSTLRQFARKPPGSPAEHCELCSRELPPDHAHLYEPATGKLTCSCDACAVLFSGREGGRYKRVPRDVESLSGFVISDDQWDDLRLPINLTFFVANTPAQRVLAFYPSPAGAVESLLPLEAWDALVEQNPVLSTFEPDVEALLVNRVNGEQTYLRAPIDECFKLVGVIRVHWRGLSGGTRVWDEVSDFFAELRNRLRPR